MKKGNVDSEDAVASAEAAGTGDTDLKYRFPPNAVPETDANFVSKLTISWAQPLFDRASYLHKQNKALEHDDLIPLPLHDHADHVAPAFEEAWLIDKQREEEATAAAVNAPKNNSDNKNSVADTKQTAAPVTLSNLQGTASHNSGRIKRALLKMAGPSFLYGAGSIKLLNTGLQFTYPLLLNQILQFIEDSQNGLISDNATWFQKNKGYVLSLCLFVAMAAKAICENAYFQRVYRAGYQARSSLSVAVYNKALRLANSERQGATLGELINLMQVDATKIEMFVPQVHVLWDGVVQIIGYMAILYSLIGWSCFAGLAIMIAAGPLQGRIMGKLFGMNHIMAKFTDTRVKNTNEALQGIQSVKMYTWEDSFEQQISNARTMELGVLKRVAYLRGFSRAYMSALPGVVAVGSFVVYTFAYPGATNQASRLFAALAAFDQLRFPLLFYPMALAQLAQAQVSAARIELFLGMKEVGQSSGSSANINESIGDSQDFIKEEPVVPLTSKSVEAPVRVVGFYHRQETIEELENGADSDVGEIIVKDATIYWSDPTVPLSLTGDNDDATSISGSSRTLGAQSDGAEGDNRSTTISKNGVSTSRKSTKKEGKVADTVAKVVDLSALDEKMSSEQEIEAPIISYPKPVLKRISLHVKPKELCAVVGRVASGKSTMCSAVLNETILASGSVCLKGRVAYAAQSPWILNATLRDNILFGRPYDHQKYERVIQACQLTHDVDILEHGDLTEIGERGINLSGGQKQRVSVARAAYSDADTIILDDPLSALDPEVGKKLFNECIVELMRGKTRLFVTNQIQFLQDCDWIVALGKHSVLEQGTFEDLTQREGGELKRILDDDASDKNSHRKKRGDNSKEKEATTTDDDETGKKDEVTEVEKTSGRSNANENKGLVTREERNIGAVEWSVYKKYFQAGGGFVKFGFVFFSFILCVLIQLASTSWVSYWTSDPTYKNHSAGFYLGLYATIAVGLGVLTFVRSYLLVRFGVLASEELHHRLLHSILNAPQSFFDTTPLGRILSRFSKDLYSIDTELTEQLDFFLSMTISVLFSLGAIMFVTPWFGISIVPLGFFYFTILNYFRNVSRETKRLESISRSPVYAQFSETLGGLTTIRAYGEETRFRNEFDEKADQNIRAWYNNKVSDRWLSVRLELIGAIVTGVAAVCAINVAVSNSVSGYDSDNDFASLAGLSLSFSIGLTGMLNWCVRTFAMLEAGMNATERVLYYGENIPQEAPRTCKELESYVSEKHDRSGSFAPSTPWALAVLASGGKAETISSDWPNVGTITMNNLRMKYREDTPLVLKGLSIEITGGQRIGVVGRTGSGKSSLLLTLLRLVEPTIALNGVHEYEAPLTIDGLDALRVGLKELRSKLGIIPQNPVLFSGTVRSNVDPFNQYSDDEIWGALEKCGMKAAVEEMAGMLSASISEYGENLSAGSRQMLVLGRALLRQCRILLLDEATSSVDYETDRQIQRTIREAFPGCTVLTIAHRINTILDSDKILVMTDGVVGEFGPPQELLADENSFFSDIVRHAEADYK